MTIKEFKYYMHDDYDSYERADYISGQIEWDGTHEELVELMGEPFYEIQLNCTLDTETGQVEIVSASSA